MVRLEGLGKFKKKNHQLFTELNKGKGKVVLALYWLNTKPLRGMGKWRFNSTILDLGTRGSCQLHAPVALTVRDIGTLVIIIIIIIITIRYSSEKFTSR
jgi:hypothetical protein